MKTKYTVISYKDIDKTVWDQFVKSNDEAWFWHFSKFMEAWPYGENISFAILNNRKEVVLIQALRFLGKIQSDKDFHIMKIIISLYSKLKRNNNHFSSVGGFARKSNMTSKEEHSLSQFYIEYMDELVNRYQISYFNYSIQATLPPQYWPGCCPVVNPMIFYGYQNKISQSYVIDLSKGEEEIFGVFSQTTRNLINRCKRDSFIKIEEAKPTQEDLDKYYRLHVETYERTGVTPHPKTYFEHIFMEILKDNYCHILFLYSGETLIAAHNTLLFKKAAMYWTGASITDKGEGESRLLMYEQILYAKRCGCKYFECGEVFPNVRKGKLKGLSDFKKSFGGIVYPLFSGAYIVEK